jgi:hypothetical protein
MAKHLYGKKGTKRSRWGKRAQFLGCSPSAPGRI